jgi:hypothetical protein
MKWTVTYGMTHLAPFRGEIAGFGPEAAGLGDDNVS